MQKWSTKNSGLVDNLAQDTSFIQGFPYLRRIQRLSAMHEVFKAMWHRSDTGRNLKKKPSENSERC